MMTAYLPGICLSRFSVQLKFSPQMSIPLYSFPVYLMNFMISFDILYILRQSIIQLCGTISYAFFVVNPRHGYIFPSPLTLLEDNQCTVDLLVDQCTVDLLVDLYTVALLVDQYTVDLLVLYIDLRPGQTCHSKVMHRKEVTHSNGQ